MPHLARAAGTGAGAPGGRPCCPAAAAALGVPASAIRDARVPLATGRPVRSLPADLGYSERHLRRLCHDAFGYGPKTLHRILRFQRAIGLIHAGRSLGEVAASCGFADQAHLTREVGELAGRPPSLLAA